MLRKTPRYSILWLLSLTALVVGTLFVWLALSTGSSAPVAYAQVTGTATPTDTATPTVTPTPNPNCILDVNKDDNVSSVPEGGQITYTITVSNDGTEPAGECIDLDVVDTIPTDTDCVSASVSSASDIDPDDFDVDGCDSSGDVVWSTNTDFETGDEVVLQMVVELTSGADEDEVISNTACATSTNDEGGECDSVRTTVGAPVTPTPTTAPTATPVPTVPPPPVVPTVPPPPPPPLPTLAPPPTGTGPSAGTMVFWAIAGIATAGGLLLLGGGVAWSRRTR